MRTKSSPTGSARTPAPPRRPPVSPPGPGPGPPPPRPPPRHASPPPPRLLHRWRSIEAGRTASRASTQPSASIPGTRRSSSLVLERSSKRRPGAWGGGGGRWLGEQAASSRAQRPSPAWRAAPSGPPRFAGAVVGGGRRGEGGGLGRIGCDAEVRDEGCWIWVGSTWQGPAMAASRRRFSTFQSSQSNAEISRVSS